MNFLKLSTDIKSVQRHIYAPSCPTFYGWNLVLEVAVVEFVLAPQHETSCDSEIIKKEDFDYWRK